MVLVAAIAAGVLINTAGLLQSQAEATGEESAQQVSDRVQVASLIGSDKEVVDNDGTPDFPTVEDRNEEEINLVEVNVFRSPGAGDIDLTSAIVEVFANGQSATLTHEEVDGEIQSSIEDYDSQVLFDADDGDTTIPDEEFRIVNIQDADGGVLSDSGDRAALVFELQDIDGSPTLEEGDSITLTITTAAGGTAFVEKRAPSSIGEGETVRL